MGKEEHEEARTTSACSTRSTTPQRQAARDGVIYA